MTSFSAELAPSTFGQQLDDAFAGPQNFFGIVTVDMGTSNVPAGWFKTALAAAWPGVLIENTLHSAVSQVNFFLKRWTADGRPIVWQMGVDVDNNSGFEGICNLEAIDILGGGVIASPISMSRAGEVSINYGIPVAGIALAVSGKVRSFNVGAATNIGRYEFGDGSAYVLGDSTVGAIGFYIGDLAVANATATGLFPQTTNAFDHGSASFRWKSYWGVSLDLSGSANVTGAYKVAGTQVVGPRQTGWTAATGTPARGAFAAAAAGTASVGYVQAELQAALTRIAALEARLIALEADARAHGLIN